MPASPPLTDAPADATLTVRPWPDEVIDRIGHDPRSTYVERFWLPVLGPSSVLLLRRFATELEAQPAGTTVGRDVMARSLGLSTSSARGSTFLKAIQRCRQFRLLHVEPDGATVLVRRMLPPLNRGQSARLPEPLRAEHDAWLLAGPRGACSS